MKADFAFQRASEYRSHHNHQCRRNSSHLLSLIIYDDYRTWSAKLLLIAYLNFLWKRCDFVLWEFLFLGIKEKLQIYNSVLHPQFLIQNYFALLCETEIKSAFRSEEKEKNNKYIL